MTTLDELRKANLQEQRASVRIAPEVVKKADPELKAPSLNTEPVRMESVSESAAKLAADSVQPPVPMPQNGAAHSPANGATATGVTKAATVDQSPVIAEPPVAIAATGQALNEYMDLLRAQITRKAVHPSGVKVTVDMSPELFWRLKRYSRDHGNPSLRQVCIEVVTAFLEQEEY